MTTRKAVRLLRPVPRYTLTVRLVAPDQLEETELARTDDVDAILDVLAGLSNDPDKLFSGWDVVHPYVAEELQAWVSVEHVPVQKLEGGRRMTAPLTRKSNAHATAQIGTRNGRGTPAANPQGHLPPYFTCFVAPDGQVVGHLVRDRNAELWLTKEVNTARHRLRQPPAWYVPRAYLEQLRVIGAAGIELHDEEGSVWRATLDDFDRDGFQLTLDGPEIQVAVQVPFWELELADASVHVELFEEVP